MAVAREEIGQGIRLEIRAQTPQEEFEWLESVLNELPWYEQNGYTLGLPNDPALRRSFDPQERERVS